MTIGTLQEKERPIRVLVVEDNKGDIVLLKRAFERSNVPHMLTVVRTGEDALFMLDSSTQNTRSDMVILDLNLPGMSGHEVLSAIKTSSHYRYIPVFILSSSCAHEDVISSYNAHANCYIVKPHDLEALREIVDQVGQFFFSLAVLPTAENGGCCA